MDQEIINYLNKQAQPVFNILYVVLGFAAVVSAIICGIMITWTKEKPDKRKVWLKALIWIFIGIVIAYASVGLINIIIETLRNNQTYQPKLE